MIFLAKHIILFICLISSVVSRGQIVINEFLASNQNLIIDSLGSSSDWIELYNKSDEVVNLEGWYLSDKKDDLSRWKFPKTEILADSFLLIFASGEDTFDGYFYHSNFKLSADGESIILSNDQNEIVDSVSF